MGNKSRIIIIVIIFAIISTITFSIAENGNPKKVDNTSGTVLVKEPLNNIAIRGSLNKPKRINHFKGLISKRTNDLGQKITVVKANEFSISKAVKELPITRNTGLKKKPERLRRQGWNKNKSFNNQALPKGEDPLRQINVATRKSRDVIVNFEGNDDAMGGQMDPSGAAGPNHYVQATNFKYQIWDKSGNSLAGPFELKSLWENVDNHGDPIVFYDKFADRWLISQFSGMDENQIYLAISQTPDPTGQYYTYKFTFPEFPDYFKISIWHDGYYMTANTSSNEGTACVFEREKLLKGDANARVVILTAPDIKNSYGFTVVMPAFADGELPSPTTKCNFFSMTDDSWGHDKDAIQIWTFTTDWNNTENCKVELTQTLETEPFDLTIRDQEWADIDQPGTSQRIDGGESFLNYRVQFRKWVGYNTIILTHVSEITDNSGHTGIRWYELRDNDDNIWSIYQSGTYAPDNHSRFYASAAMDKYGNIGLAYSLSSSSIKPSLAFTGRLASDPKGEMTIKEKITAEGLDVQTGGYSFCDYSHMSVDPDDETLWHTGQYVGENESGKTKIFAFKLNDNVTKSANIFHTNLQIKHVIKHNKMDINIQGLYNNKNIQVDLFSINGKLIFSNSIKPHNHNISVNFDIKNIAKGRYLLRIGNIDFQKIVKIKL